MNDEGTNIFANQLRAIGEAMVRDWVWPSPEGGFAQYLFHSQAEGSPISASVLTWPTKESFNQAPSLASAGYLMRIQNADSDSEDVTNWLDGATRLRGKNAFPADRQSFAYRPLELYGIGIGIVSSKGRAGDLRDWFAGVIQRLVKESDENDLWSQALVALVSEEFSVPYAFRAGNLFEKASLDWLSLLRWIHSSHPSLAYVESLKQQLTNLDSTLLKRFALEVQDGSDLARAASRFSSLRAVVSQHIQSSVGETWQFGKQSRDAVNIVEKLCRRFHLFAIQMAVRYAKRTTISIADEYDVQDLTHALLKIFFDDVRAEEVAPSYAGKSTRMDFLLKPEKIVVETKMTRKGLDQNGVANELIEDKARYQTHPDIRTLICLVYDPGHICKNPASLESDVSGDDGNLRCIVIVTPKGL